MLLIRVEGPDKSGVSTVRSLSLAISLMGKASLALDQEMVLKFEADEMSKLNSTGSRDRYYRIKTLTDAPSQDAPNADVRVILRGDFDSGLDDGGDQFQTIRDVPGNLGVVKIAVEGVPASEQAGDGG